MTKTTLTKDQLKKLERVRQNMAMEGLDRPLEEMIPNAERLYASGRVEDIERLYDEALQSGRSILEVVQEYLSNK